MEKTPSEKANFVTGFLLGAAVTSTFYWGYRLYKEASNKSKIQTDSTNTKIQPEK